MVAERLPTRGLYLQRLKVERKLYKGTNTLAYFSIKSISKKKSFIKLRAASFECQCYETFFFVTDIGTK